MNITLNERQQHTVIAALRYYQREQTEERNNLDNWIEDLATNGGDLTPLAPWELDNLVAKFNEEAGEECNDCTAMVDSNDSYFATPCGTFCDECMEDHVKECEICAKEFEADFPEDVCDKCGDPTDDGEGYDGLCGNFSDKEYKKSKHQ